MAAEVRIKNSDANATIRNAVLVPVLGLVTLGIYVIFWYYYINREMADLGRARGTRDLGESPGTSVLAITLGALVIVPAIVSIVNTCKRVRTAQRLAGRTDELNMALALILLLLLGPVGYWYIQNELNKVWERETEPLAGAPAAAAAAPQQPAAEQQAPPAGEQQADQ